ncbi:MAG TPA: DegT/DnrJ/EryC1/StrS family aminotransferase [Candidatus Latescibacteria bacterium]|nr:DegT/DnrJ/EryC1/StrS family aminotransferase [Candidatus Latescibacterota bacterium]
MVELGFITVEEEAANMSEKLAILGGKPAIEIKEPERWRRPVEEEKKLVCQLLDEGFVSGSGTGLPKEFEEDIREYVGCNFCLTVDHGSTALASAYYAVGVGPGDEVITPTAGYIGSYCGALHLGARPVFCDIDPKTLLVDPEDVERKITKRTRAINIIHFHGNVCDMDAFLHIRDKYGIPIVEDAAHALGAEWDGKKIGTIGDIACFSLQGSNPIGKPVAGGEGGFVTTNVRELYERQLIYCHLHRAGVTDELTNPAYKGLDSEVLGLKWRAHPLALALAKVSLNTLEYRIKRSNENREKIFEALREIPGLEPEGSHPKVRRVNLYGGLRIIYHPEALEGLPVERFVEALKAEGVPVKSLGFPYLEHLRKIFREGFDLWGRDRGPLGGEFCGLPPFKPYKEGDFPVAEDVHRRVINIPSYINPAEGFLDQLIGAFRKVVENYKSLLSIVR